MVRGDASQLRSALTNLIFNAVDAIIDEGTIRIEAKVDVERVRIEVSDTGSGMSAEQVLQRAVEIVGQMKEPNGVKGS